MAFPEQLQDQLNAYTVDLFAPEDDALRWIQAQAERSQLPRISIAPFEGRVIQLLLRAIDAHKVVEIGSLAGYSGTWIARALPPADQGGKLYTLEKSAKHAQISRAAYAHAGVADRVELLEGTAIDLLRSQLSALAPFDFVFLDADRPSYLDYLAWAVDHVRSGGIVAAHNAFRAGRIIAPENDEDHAMRAFNEALANHPQLESGVVGVGDGLALGIKR